MIDSIPPAFVLILGSLLVPLLRNRMVKSVYLLLLPLIAFLNILYLPSGESWRWPFLGYELIMGRVDGLSLPFGYIFCLAVFIGTLYSLKVRDDEHMAALIYSGSALGAVFSGDLLSLFFFWEVMAFASAYLIWARRSPASYQAGLRYLLVHLVGGILLLVGIVIHVQQAGSIQFGHMGLSGTASYLILLGFGLNAAFPLLHAWLPDAYPEATFSGTVFLSAFTTKTAVYVLARSFAGTELLIWAGAIMVTFPIFYAVIENNLRRVLSYSLINQVGFMVAGIGIGTELALNGTVAHAFAHILYKALLFMSMGAVLHQTGKINCTDLGGLYKTMPLTTIFCIIGAVSISGFPLFSGFVSKSMIISAAGIEGLSAAWLVLMFASAGVLHHSGIKIPFFAFFSHDSGIRTTDPPLHMLLAMGIAAFFCVAIGVFPGYLYSILPYPVDYVPYTAAHVVDALQLLLFAALAFTLMLLGGVDPVEMRCVNLDADWFYRKGAKAFMYLLNNPLARVGDGLRRLVFELIPSGLLRFSRDPVSSIRIGSESILRNLSHSPARQAYLSAEIKRATENYPRNLKKHWTVAPTATWIVLLLLAYLVIYYSY
ncbi:MAG: Na(+)/H(+) antiporter subunit D [Smithellaceae bacterium]|nr:Na(+)/H(+) antiporter subunit D [Smithellaceae bacterium]